MLKKCKKGRWKAGGGGRVVFKIFEKREGGSDFSHKNGRVGKIGEVVFKKGR